MAGGDFADFMLAIAVEGGPLDRTSIISQSARAPVKRHVLTGVTDDKLAAFVMAGQTNYKRSELCLSARGVYMGLKKARGS